MLVAYGFVLKVSWCKVEVTVANPKDFNPFPDTDPQAPKDVPPLTVMSMSVRTIVNHVENNCEVVCATTRIWANSKCKGNLTHIPDSYEL